MSRGRQVLWGFQPGSDPIEITKGTAAQCQREQGKRARDGWVCTILPEGAEPGLLRDLAAAATSRFDDELGFTVITAGELADFQANADAGFAWTCRTAKTKGGTSWDRGKIVSACEISSADRAWYEQHQLFHERSGPEPYRLPKPWAPPPRRAYQPGPMDPGQPVTWTWTIGGHWEREDGQPVIDPVTGGPTGQWVESVTRTRTGTVWSGGPASASTSWWVVPDDDPANPVVVRRHGRKFSFERAEGQLYQDDGWAAGWRDEIRRAENVRRRGVYPVVREVIKGSSWGYSRGRDTDRKVIEWHADPECPDAAGKDRDDGEGAAWDRGVTVNDVVDVLTHRVQTSGTPPYCKRCIMLEPAPEATPALAGTVSASV